MRKVFKCLADFAPGEEIKDDDVVRFNISGKTSMYTVWAHSLHPHFYTEYLDIFNLLRIGTPHKEYVVEKYYGYKPKFEGVFRFPLYKTMHEATKLVKGIMYVIENYKDDVTIVYQMLQALAITTQSPVMTATQKREHFQSAITVSEGIETLEDLSIFVRKNRYEDPTYIKTNRIKI